LTHRALAAADEAVVSFATFLSRDLLPGEKRISRFLRSRKIRRSVRHALENRISLVQASLQP
jgi:hypothetical protein